MSFGRLGRDGGARPMSDINMVPLIDVMLVLLVIFIITAPLIAPALRVELPPAAGVAAAPPASVLRVTIDRDGRLHLDDAAIDADQLAARLAEAAQRDPRTELHLRADRGVPYGHVAELIDLVQRAGLGRIGFVTAPPPPR
jgi:biopolymer transport protein ExbD/biopolymer transport protein TolR